VAPVCLQKYLYVHTASQDVNAAQYELVRLLRQGCTSGSVFVVGDPNQAIFTWRGANPANMEQAFIRDFAPNCRTLYLTENYRCACHRHGGTSFAPLALCNTITAW
jgi:superfamily I DNA/RNA helicase